MSNARFSIIQAKAVRDSRISDSVFRTLSALGMYSDENGWCFPKQQTIADDIGKTRQTVNEHIGMLVEFGYLEKRPQFRQDGSQTSNLYRLLFDTPVSSLEPTPPVKPANDTNNDPLDDPSNNTSPDVKSRPVTPLPLEWQIVAGQEISAVENDEMARMDVANLLSMGKGINTHLAYAIAYTFMRTRGIIIPEGKIKGNRKPLKEMIEMGVLPTHVEEATKKLMDAKMTVTDLFSIAKTAIDLANPAPETYSGAIDGV